MKSYKFGSAAAVLLPVTLIFASCSGPVDEPERDTVEDYIEAMNDANNKKMEVELECGQSQSSACKARETQVSEAFDEAEEILDKDIEASYEAPPAP